MASVAMRTSRGVGARAQLRSSTASVAPGRKVAACSARVQPDVEAMPDLQTNSSRRASLMMVAAALSLSLQPVKQAQAVAASTLCVDAETEEEDTQCRRAALAGDAGKLDNYGDVSNRKFELAPNVPVADLNDAYSLATLKLAGEIEQYCVLDVYDKQRIPLIKALKADGTEWVSKYARGGSARTQSARRMYIAVDAVIGHLSSNGYAPLPLPKVKSVQKSLDEAKDLLAKRL